MSTAEIRLAKERKEWRKNSVYGFVAKPTKNSDGTLNLMIWDCVVPGKKGTPFENGLFKLKLFFSVNYPLSPPACKFDPPIFHPNVFGNGSVCCSIFNSSGWHADITIKQILLCMQDLLGTPNISSPANGAAAELYKKDIDAYNNRVRNSSQSAVQVVQ